MEENHDEKTFDSGEWKAMEETAIYNTRRE
jgi:hypothetical protein